MTEPDTSSSACPEPPYVPLQTNAADWPCPPAEAIHEIDAVIFVQFRDDPTGGTLVCHAVDGSVDLTRLQERVYQTLYLLKRLQFDTPLPWTGSTVWTWFTESVQNVVYIAPTAGGLPEFRSECFGGGTMYISATSPSASGVGFPQSVFGFVHEARHAQKLHDCGITKDMNIPELVTCAYSAASFLPTDFVRRTVVPFLSGTRVFITSPSVPAGSPRAAPRDLRGNDLPARSG